MAFGQYALGALRSVAWFVARTSSTVAPEVSTMRRSVDPIATGSCIDHTSTQRVPSGSASCSNVRRRHAHARFSADPTVTSVIGSP